MEAMAMHVLYQNADHQTGEVEIGCVAIAKAINIGKVTKGEFQDHLRRVAQAVDSLTAKGIIETLRPGVGFTKDAPANCAKRRIVFTPAST